MIFHEFAKLRNQNPNELGHALYIYMSFPCDITCVETRQLTTAQSHPEVASPSDLWLPDDHFNASIGTDVKRVQVSSQSLEILWAWDQHLLVSFRLELIKILRTRGVEMLLTRAPGCSQVPLASQLVLLHLLLCQSLSYCLQLCLSDRAFPQALSPHKQMHVPIFPSVCAASSASLMDTCQKTPPLHDFSYFQHFTLHSLLSACAACRHATKQTERTLLRSKPVKIKISYSLHSSPMNLDATNISSINHICMATLFLKHVQTPSTSSLALDKAKTDHIHCNLPRLGVLSFCDKPQ